MDPVTHPLRELIAKAPCVALKQKLSAATGTAKILGFLVSRELLFSFRAWQHDEGWRATISGFKSPGAD
jgi:hypothetical protein